MDATGIKDELDQLAVELREVDERAADRLVELGGAVGLGLAVDRWVGADIFRLIDPEGVAEKYRQTQGKDGALFWLEGLRNVLVFVPVLITWVGIADAVDHYATLLRTTSDAALNNQSFLFLWQDRFDGTSRFSLAQIAWADAGVLGLVALLTLVVYWLARQLEQVNAKSEDLRHRLSQALADTTLFLRSQHALHPHQFEHLAQGLLNEIGKERERIEALAARKEKELADFSLFSGTLRKAAEQIQQSISRLDAAQATQTSNLHSFMEPVKQLAEQQKVVTALVQQAQGQFAQLIQAQGQVYGQQKTLLESSQRTEGELLRIADIQRAWGQNLHEAIDSLTDSATAVTRLTSAFASTANNLIQSETQLMGSLQQEREAQAQLARNVSEATAGLEQTLKTIQSHATVLHGLAVDLSDLIVSLRLVPQMLNGVTGVTNEYHAATLGMAQASQDLYASVAYLDQTLQAVAARLGQGTTQHIP